jgi:hypothetical protein
MNYAQFAEYIKDVQRDLVERFGIPEHAANDIAQYAEVTGIAEEAKAKHDAQYELNYRQYGSQAMADRHRITQQAARKRFRKVINKRIPKVSAVVSL